MNLNYVLFSAGEYSDYQNAAFRVLKPFTLEQVNAEFLAQFKPGPGPWQDTPGVQEFLAFMVAQGYICDAEIPEIYLGYYGYSLSKCAQKELQFTPAPDSKEQA